MMRHGLAPSKLLPAGKSESGYVDPQELDSEGVSLFCIFFVLFSSGFLGLRVSGFRVRGWKIASYDPPSGANP